MLQFVLRPTSNWPCSRQWPDCQLVRAIELIISASLIVSTCALADASPPLSLTPMPIGQVTDFQGDPGVYLDSIIWGGDSPTAAFFSEIFRSDTGLESTQLTGLQIPGGGTISDVWESRRLDNQILFQGSGDPGEFGTFIYDASSGQLRIVANEQTIASSGAPYQDYGPIGAFVPGGPILRGSQRDQGGNGVSVTFWAIDFLFNQYILLHDGLNLTTVAQTSGTAPGGNGTFQGFGFRPSGSNENIAYMGISDLAEGVYLHSLTQGTSVVADSATAVPNGSGTFSVFTDPVIHDTDVAFLGWDAANVPGFYAELGNGLSVLADTNTPVPGGGTFGNFTDYALSRKPIANESGGTTTFAFRAEDGSSEAIFADLGSGIERIVGVGDILDGRTVQSLSFGREGLFGDSLALNVTFADGVRTIYLASPGSTLSGDFNGDGAHNITDLNLMLAEGPIAAGVMIDPGVNDQFDLDGNGQIDNSDRDVWLGNAAVANGLGSPYKLGDANLDGMVDELDFMLWNGNKFLTSLLWNEGDFNGDGLVNGRDFLLWNAYKFSSSDAASIVPEPAGWALVCMALCMLSRRRSQ